MGTPFSAPMHLNANADPFSKSMFTRGPCEVSVLSLVTELVTKFRPPPDARIPLPPSTLGERFPAKTTIKGHVARSYQTLLNQSIASQIKCPLDIPQAHLETLFALFLLKLRSSHRLFDRATRIEHIVHSLLDREPGSPPLLMAYPCTRFHLLGMRRSGWVPQPHVHASAESRFSGLPVHPMSNSTMNAVLLLLALLSNSNYEPAPSPRDLIPARSLLVTDQSHLSADPSSCLIDNADIQHNPSLRNAVLQNPWRNVYSDTTMQLNNDIMAQSVSADDFWDENTLKPPPALDSSGFPIDEQDLASFHAITANHPQPTRQFSTASFQSLPSLVSLLDGFPQSSIMDWLPEVPALSAPSSGLLLSRSFRDMNSTTMTGSNSSALDVLGFSSSKLFSSTDMDSTDTWQLANDSRSVVPQPGSTQDLFSVCDPPNLTQTDPWVWAGRNTQSHFYSPLLQWDAPVTGRSEPIEYPQVVPEPPFPSPFLTDASPQVQAEIMERAFLGVPSPGEGIPEDILVRHVYLLICGVESPTFRWLGDPTVAEIALDTVNQPPLLKFDYRHERTLPPRVSGISPRSVVTFMNRFINIGSGLQRLELVARDLRNRLNFVGFTGRGLAQALDDLVGRVRALVLEWRHRPGRMCLRACFTGMERLEHHINEICKLLGSSEKRLHRIGDFNASSLLALVANFAQALALSCPDPSSMYISEWSLVAFSQTVQPMLRWIHQWLTAYDPHELGVVWDATDPHREFPVVWTAQGPTLTKPSLNFWSSGFQVRAEYLNEDGVKFILIPCSVMKRLTDVDRVFNTLSACFGRDHPLIPPRNLLQWTNYLIWPMSFPDLNLLLKRRNEQIAYLTSHIKECAEAIEASNSSKVNIQSMLHVRSQNSQAQHRLIWLAERRSARTAIANRKRKLMNELRDFAQLRARLVEEDRRSVALVEERRIRSELQNAEYWSQLIEREKKQLLSEYEAKIQKSKKEMDRILWRRRRLELNSKRAGLDADYDLESRTGSVSFNTDTEMPDASPTRGSDTQTGSVHVPPISNSDDESRAPDVQAPPPVDPDTFPNSPPDIISMDCDAPSVSSCEDDQRQHDGAGAPPYVPLRSKPSGLIQFPADSSNLCLSTLSRFTPPNSPKTPTTAASPSCSRDTSSPIGFQKPSNSTVLSLNSFSDSEDISFNMALVSFRRYMTSNLALCEYALLASVLTIPQLLPELEKLPLVFCFQNPQFRQNLFGALSPRVLGKRPLEDVESALVRAFDNVDGFSVSVNPVPLNGAGGDHDPHLFNFLSFGYKPGPAMWMLVSSETVSAYNVIMRFIVRLQYFDYATKSLYQSVRATWHLPIPTGQYPPAIATTLESIAQSISTIDTLLCRFHAEALHTVNAVWGYTCDVAVGDAWQSFVDLVKRLEGDVIVTAKHKNSVPVADGVDGITSVRGLHEAHCEMVNTILFRCMLRPKQAPLQDSIDAQIRAVLAVEDIAREYVQVREQYIKLQFPSATLGKDGKRGVRFIGQVAHGIAGIQQQLPEKYAQLMKHTERFRNYSRRIIALLRNVNHENLGSVLVENGTLRDKTSGLEDLLVRLDFNHFFRQWGTL